MNPSRGQRPHLATSAPVSGDHSSPRSSVLSGRRYRSRRRREAQVRCRQLCLGSRVFTEPLDQLRRASWASSCLSNPVHPRRNNHRGLPTQVTHRRIVGRHSLPASECSPEIALGHTRHHIDHGCIEPGWQTDHPSNAPRFPIGGDGAEVLNLITRPFPTVLLGPQRSERGAYVPS